MDKHAILAQIICRLEEELDTLAAAARDARAYATDAESRAEDKYDTRALESSYLADGQGRLAAEVAETLKAYRALALREFAPGEPIALTALVEIEQPAGRDLYFLGPRGGGLSVEHAGREVYVLTPQSPLGRELLGRSAGGTVTLPNGRPARVGAVA